MNMINKIYINVCALCSETDPCKPNPCGIHEKCEFKNNIITCNCAGNLREKNCGGSFSFLNLKK